VNKEICRLTFSSASDRGISFFGSGDVGDLERIASLFRRGVFCQSYSPIDRRPFGPPFVTLFQSYSRSPERTVQLGHGNYFLLAGFDLCGIQKYRVFQKELYNFESLYKCIQRTCTVI
jgi:hypothetical protein